MKAKLVRALKVVLAMFGGLIVIAILPPQFGDFWLVVLLGFGVAAFWWTRDRGAIVASGPAVTVNPASTAQVIRTGRQKLWVSALAFVVAIGG